MVKSTRCQTIRTVWNQTLTAWALQSPGSILTPGLSLTKKTAVVFISWPQFLSLPHGQIIAALEGTSWL